MKYRRSIVVLLAMFVCLWIGLPVYGAYPVCFTDTASHSVFQRLKERNISNL